MGITRRQMAIGAVLGGAAAWLLWPVLRGSRPGGVFDFVALTDPAGFRSLATADFSAARDPLAGLQGSGPAIDGDAMARVRADLCGALFGSGAHAADAVPIAYFTDYRCAFCRVLSGHIAKIEQEAAGAVTVAWHEWPVLGEASELAARAALAARRQGAYAAFHARLMRSSFVPTPAYLESLAAEIGVDAGRLLRDMRSPAVQRELSETRALAALFRFAGTPGLVVGRTAVMGAIGEGRLRGLIQREQADGPVPACAGDGSG